MANSHHQVTRLQLTDSFVVARPGVGVFVVTGTGIGIFVLMGPYCMLTRPGFGIFVLTGPGVGMFVMTGPVVRVLVTMGPGIGAFLMMTLPGVGGFVMTGPEIGVFVMTGPGVVGVFMTAILISLFNHFRCGMIVGMNALLEGKMKR